jgi:hypothetical protein
LFYLNISTLFYFTFGDKISQQPENFENRNDPDLVQAFLKKWQRDGPNTSTNVTQKNRGNPNKEQNNSMATLR